MTFRAFAKTRVGSSRTPLRLASGKALRHVLRLTVVAAVLCFGESCYTLNGVSIGPDTQSFYISQFDVTTSQAPPALGQLFSELLKQRINSNTRLAFADENPDVEFVGSLTGFVVTPEAPNPNTGADLNRLTISVQVDYTDSKTPKNNYTQTFTDFENFPGNVDLLVVQDQLVEVLFERLSEEVFNKAFSNW